MLGGGQDTSAPSFPFPRPNQRANTEQTKATHPLTFLPLLLTNRTASAAPSRTYHARTISTLSQKTSKKLHKKWPLLLNHKKGQQSTIHELENHIPAIIASDQTIVQRKLEQPAGSRSRAAQGIHHVTPFEMFNTVQKGF